MSDEGNGLQRESAERQSWLDAAKKARLDAMKESGQFFRTIIPFSTTCLVIYLYLLEAIAGMADLFAGMNLAIAMPPAVLLLISTFFLILAFVPPYIDIDFDEEDRTIGLMRSIYRRRNRLCLAGLTALTAGVLLGIFALFWFALSNP